MYPIDLMFFFPLSASHAAWLPLIGSVPSTLHACDAGVWRFAPMPINESGVLQSSSWLPRIPIRTLGWCLSRWLLLNPCRPHFDCNDECASNDFHLLRLMFVVRNFPSAIRLYNDRLSYAIVRKRRSSSTFIPIQSSLNEVLQYVGSFVSTSSKPDLPPTGL